MLDDVLYVLRKCVRRALSSANVDCVCAVMNNAATILDTTYMQVLQGRLKVCFREWEIVLSFFRFTPQLVHLRKRTQQQRMHIHICNTDVVYQVISLYIIISIIIHIRNIGRCGQSTCFIYMGIELCPCQL